MVIIESVVELQNELFTLRKSGKTVGLVPTMGALHEGHASLIRRSVAENDITVVSIFVNPTQFNDSSDFKSYPRDIEKDCIVAQNCGATYVFSPQVSDIYPTPDTRFFDFPPITTVMEGAYRPGHFNGVCQVVSRLFYITKPDKAYFGEKDWQQVAVIKTMVLRLGINVSIVECPTVRDIDGLAMSSRNTLLSIDERKEASNIRKILLKSVDYATSHTPKETINYVTKEINATPELSVEYFTIIDTRTFLDISLWPLDTKSMGHIAVWCGKRPVRLIDHITYGN